MLLGDTFLGAPDKSKTLADTATDSLLPIKKKKKAL